MKRIGAELILTLVMNVVAARNRPYAKLVNKAMDWLARRGTQPAVSSICRHVRPDETLLILGNYERIKDVVRDILLPRELL